MKRIIGLIFLFSLLSFTSYAKTIEVAYWKIQGVGEVGTEGVDRYAGDNGGACGINVIDNRVLFMYLDTFDNQITADFKSFVYTGEEEVAGEKYLTFEAYLKGQQGYIYFILPYSGEGLCMISFLDNPSNKLRLLCTFTDDDMIGNMMTLALAMREEFNKCPTIAEDYEYVERYFEEVMKN